VNNLTLKDVDNAVCAAFVTTPDLLKGRKRARQYAFPRMAFCDLARSYTERSYPQIGAYLGRDHTTVLHHVRRSPECVMGYPGYARKLQQAARILEADPGVRRKIRCAVAPTLTPDLSVTG
jgi:chromosomal replication initiator protein